MKLRNNDGVKFKITTTRNHRVYTSPYYRGVYLWERLPVVVQTLASKSDFRKASSGQIPQTSGLSDWLN